MCFRTIVLSYDNLDLTSYEMVYVHIVVLAVYIITHYVLDLHSVKYFKEMQ